ncbi:MAG: S8 family serine peptidase [Candidatus Bathyarchaeia archaeon]
MNTFRGANASFSGIVNGDYIVADDDSVQLIIGVDYIKSRAYENIANAVANGQGRIVNTISIKGEVIAVVADVPLNTFSLFIEQVSKSPFIRYIEPNMKRQALIEPNDPYWNNQWGPKKIEANYAWNTTLGSSDILVAVVDTGVDYTHPDLAGNYVNLGYDWVNNKGDPKDDFGHGTHCAGIIAAVTNNNEGIAGLAQVKIMAEKVLDAWGSGYDDWVANGIIHAVDCGANIISMSLGGYGYSSLLHEAVKYAYNNGVLLIAAAGNDNINLKSYPAAYEEVIAVAATDQNDAKAYFSNWGEWIELAAPGVDIYSTMPTYPVTLNNYGFLMNYDYMSGTSMACPHVAGVAALVWSIYPAATSNWVRTQLRYTAKDLGDPDFDEYYGYGRVDAKKSVEQEPPSHDLLVFRWDKPRYIKLGERVVSNVTVLNFGVSNESNIEVRLLVNDTQVDSKIIGSLQMYKSTTVSLSWTLYETGVHNVTCHVVPVPGETEIGNNRVTELLYVILPPSETKWVLLEEDPDEGVGCNLKAIYGQTSPNVVYFKVEYYRNWTTIEEIDTGILIDADQNPTTGLPDRTYPYQNTGIGADYLIVVGWEATEMWRWNSDIGFWDIFNPIPLAYLEAPENSNWFTVGVFLADIETNGIVDCAVADIMAWWDWMPNSGHFTWTVIQCEHDLAVLLKAPSYLTPGEHSMINATVYNNGLNAETNVIIQLIINGSIVAMGTLPELSSDVFYTMSYSWMPSEEGIYNVTVYAPPVPGENFTLNNVKAKFVGVHYPLINPEPGQYANYIVNYYDSSGKLVGQPGYLNFTYDYYIEPYKIYITVWQKDPYGYVYKDYMIVNIMNRFVEEGILSGLWYLGWIETDIDIGSTINLLDVTATVNGTKTLVAGSRVIDCWEIPYFPYGLQYMFWYDKTSGLWIGMNGTYIELFLIDTNVPIGEQSITISLNPAAGSPGTKVAVTGTRASANGNVSIYWDGTFMANTTANNLGNFSYALTVPEDALAGIHEIMAVDTTTGRMASAFFRVIIITLNPSEGPVGTKITVKGEGFMPETQAIITFNDVQIGYASVDASGDFTFVFNVPLSAAGIQVIKASTVEGYASAEFKVLDVTPLDVQVDVGALYFNGEIAEFYSQIVFKGVTVNATKLTATLYGPSGETVSYSYPENITLISTGLYKILYTVAAGNGTYALVITASYVTDTIQACGASFKSFLVSDTLMLMNNQVMEISNGVATVKTELGFVKLNLTAINATLENIFLKVTVIDGATATIQTTIGLINGTITEIEGNIATVVVPGLGQVQADVSGLVEAQEVWTIPQYLVLAFSLVAAISAVLSAVLLLKLRKFTKT